MTNSETKNFSQNVSSSYHLEDRGKCNKNTCANARNVPKLRFKGYNDEWIEYKLDEKGVFLKGSPISKNDISQCGKPCILYGELYTKYDEVATKIFSVTDIQDKNLVTSKINDVLIPSSGETAIDISTATCILNDDVILGGDLNIYRTKDCDGRFISYSINHKNRRKIAKLAQGATIFHLYPNFLKKFKILLPSLPEQEKIASFLTLIDKKIEKQKELVELLKKYKRGLLSAIFSQKLRFKDNNGNDYPAWEECRFDEIFKILGNNTLSRECLNYTNVGVKNIHYGDILVKYNTCINDEIDQIPNINFDINLDKISDDNYLKVGDVIMADTAEDYTVGKACEIVSCKAKILSGLHTIPCRPKRNFAKGYLGYYLNSTEYHDKLIPLITGIKVSAISKKEIKKTIIKYPIYKEQEKIANLLLLIENKLNSNIKKLELFETYKKGLLQQLFI